MKFDWIYSQKYNLYFIPSESNGDVFLASVSNNIDYRELWESAILTKDKFVFLTPNFHTAPQACLCAEVMLLLNRTVEEWLQCCRLEAEGTEDLHTPFFMNRAINSLVPIPVPRIVQR